MLLAPTVSNGTSPFPKVVHFAEQDPRSGLKWSEYTDKNTRLRLTVKACSVWNVLLLMIHKITAIIQQDLFLSCEAYEGVQQSDTGTCTRLQHA